MTYSARRAVLEQSVLGRRRRAEATPPRVRAAIVLRSPYAGYTASGSCTRPSGQSKISVITLRSSSVER